jgi:hypothetical protein
MVQKPTSPCRPQLCPDSKILQTHLIRDVPSRKSRINLKFGSVGPIDYVIRVYRLCNLQRNVMFSSSRSIIILCKTQNWKVVFTLRCFHPLFFYAPHKIHVINFRIFQISVATHDFKALLVCFVCGGLLNKKVVFRVLIFHNEVLFSILSSK